MVNAIFDRFDMAVEHCGVGLQSCSMNFTLKLQPAICVTLVSADHRTGGFAKDLGASARTRIKARFNQLLDDFFIAHLVEMSEVVKLNHSKSLKMQLRVFAL